MTQEQIDRVLKRLEIYAHQLEPSNREEEEFVKSIIEYFKDNTDVIIDEKIPIQDVFNELREQQSYMDGGYREDLYPDVNEDDEEYPDDYDPYDNDAYRLHSKILNKLQKYLRIEE